MFVQVSQWEKVVLLWATMFLILVFFAFVAACPTAHGQEVIMNQPSADVVNKDHLFVRFDEFYTQNPATFDENVNFAYGLGHNLEISLNNTNAFNHQPASDALVLGFKFAPIKTTHFEFYVGDQFIQPLNRKVVSHGDIAYEAVALMYGKLRLTGGSFQSHNGVALGNRSGALGGIEYTLHTFKNGWGIAPGIDWGSGAGTNGYTSPGLSFTKSSFFLCPGYMISNPHNPNGAHQTFIMTGWVW